MADGAMNLDAKDRRILYELGKGCRRPLGEIAKAVGVSKQALHYRINRLAANGVITAFIATIDFSKLGYVNHEAWLQLKLLTKEKKAAFLAHLVNHENVRLVAECGGKFDLLVGILAENTFQFNSIFNGILRKFPGVVKSYSFSISSEFYAYPRTYFLEKEERKKPHAITSEPKRIALDKTGLKLLALLSNDARMSTVELAAKAEVTAATVRAKMKRLEKEGVITGYTIVLQHSAFGYENYEILVGLHDMDEKKERELEEFCRSNQYSTYLLKCIGKWDIDIGFDVRDSTHFQEILTDFRDRFGDIIEAYEFVSILNWNKFTYYPFKH